MQTWLVAFLALFAYGHDFVEALLFFELEFFWPHTLVPMDLFSQNEKASKIVAIIIADEDEDTEMCKTESQIFIARSLRQHFNAWDRYAYTPHWKQLSMFDEEQTYDIVRKCYRSVAENTKACIYKPEEYILATITIIHSTVTDGITAALFDMSDSEINTKFNAVLPVLDTVLEPEMQELTTEEKEAGLAEVLQFPVQMWYIIDGCDFPVEVHTNRQFYKTHKENVPGHKAYRAQILLDRVFGFFRGCVSRAAGTNNDQGMLLNSKWNVPNGLVLDYEGVEADLGYATTENITIIKPATQKEIAKQPELMEFNLELNQDRQDIERGLGALQQQCAILTQPWRRSFGTLPMCINVCLKLMNRYWRLNGSLKLEKLAE